VRRALVAVAGLALLLVLAGAGLIYASGQAQPVGLRGISAGELADQGITLIQPPPSMVNQLGVAMVSAGVPRAQLPTILQPVPEVTVDRTVAEALAQSGGPSSRILETRLLLVTEIGNLPAGAQCDGNAICFPVGHHRLMWVSSMTRPDESGVVRRVLSFVDAHEMYFAVRLQLAT